MGNLLTKLRKDNLQAMKDKDVLKKGVLTLVISSIALAEKENGKELELGEELTFIQKEIKQVKEALKETPVTRTDLIEANEKKLALLESYLPKQLSEEEVKEKILAFMEENGLEPIRPNQGKIMNGILGMYKGQTDGKTVNMVLRTIIK